MLVEVSLSERDWEYDAVPWAGAMVWFELPKKCGSGCEMRGRNKTQNQIHINGKIVSHIAYPKIVAEEVSEPSFTRAEHLDVKIQSTTNKNFAKQ